MYPWERFFKEKVETILREKRMVIDIGGGLRIDPARNNRKEVRHEFVELAKKTEYRVLDKVDTYHPDIVADIQNLPFEDNSVDAILCLSVLTHVENPQKAVAEMHRVLKPGGYCLLSVPFLYYYHAQPGYYKDYYRFTRDGVEHLTRSFSTVEIQNVRGALGTIMNLFPLFSTRVDWLYFIDRLIGKEHSFQTSEYQAFCIK